MNNKKHCTHGGDAEAVAARLELEHVTSVEFDFSVNLNPLGPPPALRNVLMRGVEIAAVYPDAYASGAVRALADAHNVPPDTVLAGNGATEIFGWVLQALHPKSAAILQPCYAGYAEACRAHGVKCADHFPEIDADGFPEFSEQVLDSVAEDFVFLGTPNNPTGHLTDPAAVLRSARKAPSRLFVIDESFIDFTAAADTGSLIGMEIPENIVVVKSLTKFFAIPGLRLGMVHAQASVINRLKSVQLPWSVNGLAQELAPHLYTDTDYIQRSRQTTADLMARFAQEIDQFPQLSVHESSANFLLVKLAPPWTGTGLQAELLKRGILVRNCDSFPGLGDQYLRLAARPDPERRQFIAALNAVFQQDGKLPATVKTPRPAVMVVGTTSNAGKSIVAAGLCRALARRGLSVAPFKAQNMALNSFVTEDGGEMGRAQVVQARAAGIAPHTDMNPVLLKPTGDTGSQVIVNGQAIGTYGARNYYTMKERMRETAHQAYDRLCRRYDTLVLEGAGSPAEINLQAEDFVNMDMAHYAEARTILVADIDRGGVFATILGTIALMPPHHRRLLAGVLINKFRGDPRLLDSGIRDIEAMTGVPVLGVLPYMHDLRIEDEDSQGLETRGDSQGTVLDIAVIRLPRISNFTDFLAMENDAGVGVRYVQRADKLASPDLIIIPGTKNTRADLEWMHREGLTRAVRNARQAGTPVVGVCGGFQFLGEEVRDPHAVEGPQGTTEGLGLLPLTTEMAPEKELAQVSGTTTSAYPFSETPVEFHGYEIHVGRTCDHSDTVPPLTIVRRQREDAQEPGGAVSPDGLVFGTYVHGFFDDAALRQSLWNWLCARKSIPPDAVATPHIEGEQFDRVADTLEQTLGSPFLDELAGFANAESAVAAVRPRLNDAHPQNCVVQLARPLSRRHLGLLCL